MYKMGTIRSHRHLVSRYFERWGEIGWRPNHGHFDGKAEKIPLQLYYRAGFHHHILPYFSRNRTAKSSGPKWHIRHEAPEKSASPTWDDVQWSPGGFFSGTVRVLSQIVGTVLLLECRLIPLDCSGACCSIERDIGRIWVEFWKDRYKNEDKYLVDSQLNN